MGELSLKLTQVCNNLTFRHIPQLYAISQFFEALHNMD